MLFEVAIIELPTKKKADEDHATEKLVFGPKFVIAKDAQSAALNAVLDNAKELADVDRARMQVLIRPFA